jgi:hypothetical protein
VYDTFRQAERSASDPAELTFCIAGKNVSIRFAGSALVPALTPALQHLAASSVTNPDLTICVWDAATTKVPIPRPPWPGTVYGPRGDIQGYNDDRFRTAYHFGAGALSLLDLKRGVGIYCTRDGRDLPSYERGSPVRTILHWAFYEKGRQLVHGGAVGLPEGGVLLAGKGGSGKSTTALSCLDSDLFYASDDYSLIQPDPEPYVHSIYNTAKVNADNVARLEFLRPAISNLDRLDQQKPLMFLHKHYPQKLIAGFPIRAVLLPRVKGGTATTVTPADPTDALASLALSTIRQLAGADSRATAMIEKVTRRVPCFYLELGTDISLIPGVIRDLITHGAA